MWPLKKKTPPIPVTTQPRLTKSVSMMYPLKLGEAYEKVSWIRPGDVSGREEKGWELILEEGVALEHGGNLAMGMPHTNK